MYTETMIKSRILGLLLILSASPALAGGEHRLDLPINLSEDNPFNSITWNVLNVNVVQGFPSFQNGIDKVNGTTQYGQKQALFVGMKLWPGATVYANPELFYGYNPSNNIGVASSVNVATARVESSSPYLQLQRLFVRQVIDFGGGKVKEEENVGGRSIALENVINKLSDESGDHNLVITAGKFGIGDVFDDNIYSHDPSLHFMNLNFNSLNAIDYAGNAWGTTIGATAEYNREWLSLRAGIFQGSALPPSNNLDPIPLMTYMAIGELEIRHDWFMGNKGSIKLIPYYGHGFFDVLGGYNGVRGLWDYLPYFTKENLNRRTDWGVGLNVQQQLTDGLGLFVRVAYDYRNTDLKDITHGINGGLVFNGKLWNRPDDEFGLAVGVNAQTGSYFRSAFTEFKVGTGAPNYATEQNLETYYRFNITKNTDLTLDYQLIQNPNFLKNSDTAHVFGLRLRSNF